MKRFLLLTTLLVALVSASAQAANVYLYIGPTGQSLYGRVEETAGNFVAFALVEGTGGAKGKYYATEANIVAAGLDTASTGDGFIFTVHAGATPSTSAEDAIVAAGRLGWSGSAELTQAYMLASASAVSPYLVDADHTWRFGNRVDTTAPNIIQETIGFVGLVQLDLSDPMPANASIASITTTSVTDVAAVTEPTISSSALSADKKKVVLTLATASAGAATYTINVTIVTTDGQTIVRRGRLTLQ